MSAPRVRVLGDHVVNKIAAGEVVDRPASVVKELLENALDAGADRIEIEVAGGGRTLVRVRDNGSGMSRDDALLCVERHATSKIRDADDIEGIATLGFRGEALAAIAAVSRFELRTGPGGEAPGTLLRMAGGRILEAADIGVPRGTEIWVRNLFFNVPARRKFLRTETTESAHVRQVVLLYALACPRVALRFEAERREVYRLPATETLEERIRALFTLPAPDALRRVFRETAGLRVHGFAGVPSLNRAERGDQYLFVNGRPASAPVLGYAVREAYRTLLPTGRHPMVFLFLEVPPNAVDVNVHPTKREVRFRHAAAIRDLVLEALRQALAVGRPAPPPVPAEGLPPPAPQPPAPLLPIADLPPPRTFVFPRLPTPPEGGSPANRRGLGAPAAAPDTPAGVAPPEAAASGGQEPWAWCRVLGQVGGLFVVLETEDGLVLMDPHAAHERVLFDRLMAEALAGRVRAQGLLTPETIELSPAEAEQVRANLPVLSAMGFGVSDFGAQAFIVDAVPALLPDLPVGDLLRETAQTAASAGARGGRERWSQERLAMAACKAAVKARDRLTLDEIERLVRDLAATEMPYTCPHGRPTLIHLGFDELRRKFGRA